MKKLFLLPLCAASVLLFSCGTGKKLKASQAQYGELAGKYKQLEEQYNHCEENGKDSSNEFARQRHGYENRIATLQEQLDGMKGNNSQLLNQLKDLSVISSSQAESIKKSMDNIGAKDSYIQNLQSEISRKDSLNMALVMNLKGAIGNLDDKDINIKVEKGVVFIDISDKLLFQSGSYNITDRAKEVLGKVAKVLNNQPDIEFEVEGHTDNVPFKGNGVLIDNWDLSVKRATAVTRILQTNYGIAPARITAAGRSEYVPVATNDTPEGRAANRRTRIVILPQLDQFYKLLETK